MNIAPADLGTQVRRAMQSWPFMVGIERSFGLPPFFLFAVGSRETNLTDETGDGGHGHGVFQLDDRSHTIPAPYPVSQQATDAAAHLVGSYRSCGSWQGAADEYNDGSRPYDSATTGGDYGSDVIARMTWCQQNIPYPPAQPPEEDDMDRPGLITLACAVLCARDPNATELQQLSQPSVSDRQVVLAFLDSPDGTAIKQTRRAQAGLH